MQSFIRHAGSHKIYLPFIHPQEVAGGYIPPKQESNQERGIFKIWETGDTL